MALEFECKAVDLMLEILNTNRVTLFFFAQDHTAIKWFRNDLCLEPSRAPTAPAVQHNTAVFVVMLTKQ